MLAFYISTGLVVALFVAGYFAWTPLRVWYLERRIRSMYSGSIEDVRMFEFRKLANCGPQAYRSFERLVNRSPDLRWSAMRALRKPADSWALPLVVESANSAQFETVHAALIAAKRITGKNFVPWTDRFPSMPDPGPHRKRLLAWWESEGKAKYGRGGE
jgi:hypothetical protein